MSVKPVKHVSVSNHDIMVTTTNTNTTIIIITLINIFHTNRIYKVKVSKRNKLLKPISTVFT